MTVLGIAPQALVGCSGGFVDAGVRKSLMAENCSWSPGNGPSTLGGYVVEAAAVVDY